MEYNKYTKMGRLYKPPDGMDNDTPNISKNYKQEFPTKVLYEELKCAQEIIFLPLSLQANRVANFYIFGSSFHPLDRTDGTYLAFCRY